MNQELDKLRKEMTREEFIEEYEIYCPESRFDIAENCYKHGDCKDCWREAVKDIQFKDDIQAIEEVLTDGKKEELSTIKTTFATGAWRNNKEGKGDCLSIPPNAILRLSKLYEKGAKEYGQFNFMKGIPCTSFIDSAERHLLKYKAGWDDEDHLAAIVFNILGIMEMEAIKPEMQDIPNRQGKRNFNYKGD
jgi:hypothetical protein